MTTVIPDPIDHWVDLAQHTPRFPLSQEMFGAFDRALGSRGPIRAYWTGVGTGYAVAFGLYSRDALDRARVTPGARVLNPLEDKHRMDADRLWASGVLYGYKDGISEYPNVGECLHCEQPINRDVDPFTECVHGMFCDDCLHEWHGCLYASWWEVQACEYVPEGVAS